MARLSKILNSGRAVFADKSALRRENPRNLGWMIYDAVDFCDLSCDELLQEIDEIAEFMQILGHPNIMTTPGITEHTRRFEEILDAKISFASKRQEARNKYMRIRKNEKGARQRDLVKRLQNIVYQARLMCRDKEFQRHVKVDGEMYGRLAQMVSMISIVAGLKRDTAFMHGQRNEDRSQQTDAPERVVAALYYLSMFSSHSPALLTGNTNYVRIIGVVQRLLCADEFFPDNQELREALEHQNPVKLYVRRKTREGYTLALDTAMLKEPVPEIFQVRNLTGEENRRLRDDVGRMMNSMRLSVHYQPA